MAKPITSPPRTPDGLTSDEAYAYTSRLRLDPRTANPDDWRVDWHDGPWPVKVYTGGQRVRLRPGGAPLVAALHRVLYDGFAIRRVRADPSGGVHATPGDPRPHHGPQVLLRRPIPSGGSMYPTEVYAVLLTGADQVCHYDPYRHELTVLGDAHTVVPALREALGLPADGHAQEDLAPVLLVLTSRFWKNFYKYGDFSARLGTVDAGVAVGRAARLARAEFGHAEVRTAFDDAALNACLGLDGTEESAYAVVGLGHSVTADSATGYGGGTRGRPPAVLERSRTIRRSARFDAWQRATRTSGSDTRSGSDARSAPDTRSGPDTWPLSDVADAVELPAPCRTDLFVPRVIAQRASRGRLFTGAEVEAERLATVLDHTAEALRELARDCPDGLGARAAETELYCSPHRVSGVPAGWYRYLPDRGALIPAGTGADPGCARRVQEALFAASFNAELAAFTLHVVTPLDWRRRGGGGARGYREQQLAVGAAVEAVTLCASAEELTGHAVLGFDVTRMDRAYGLEGSGKGTQAQVCVGALRADPNWEIAVMPR
ncbi:SagB family peptide dehydrogenase [Streptomyces sp. NPDC088116]|uniref:SagB family peptide dehydrogenase n=1 Tax=Streptomyces sp. NPDC088116 TaxID=3365825 RepID=UPI0037FAE2BC